MGVDLEALREDVARWAERFAPYREDDNDWYRAAENIDGKDASELGDLFAELARHLGAGQPGIDRAALVERMCTAFDEQIEYGYTAIALDFATIALEVIEAAGWVPRAEPVAVAGETLYRLCDACLGVTWVVTAEDSETHIGCDVCCGEGYVPVAPPEPLSAGERTTLGRAIMRETWDVHDDERDEDLGSVMPRRANAALDAVLAALPARFRVPVEGA